MRKVLYFLGFIAFLAHPALANIIGNPIRQQQSSATEEYHLFSGTNLYSLTVNPLASSGYLMLFDSTAAPVNGLVSPYGCYSVAASTPYTVLINQPLAFTNGVVAAYSTGTGCYSLTLSSAFFNGQVR